MAEAQAKMNVGYEGGLYVSIDGNAIRFSDGNKVWFKNLARFVQQIQQGKKNFVAIKSNEDEVMEDDQ